MRKPLVAPLSHETDLAEDLDPRWDWSRHEFALDSAPETFGPFASLYRIWGGTGRSIPRWRDFDFSDFRGWHGRINLLEANRDDGLAFRVRLMGTTFTALFGEDSTGQVISAGVGGFVEEDLTFLARLVEGPRIGRTAGPVDWHDRDHVVVDLLYLPVSSDGGRVDRLMECGYFPGMKT